VSRQFFSKYGLQDQSVIVEDGGISWINLFTGPPTSSFSVRREAVQPGNERVLTAVCEDDGYAMWSSCLCMTGGFKKACSHTNTRAALVGGDDDNIAYYKFQIACTK
jgi:hypothetical protein